MRAAALAIIIVLFLCLSVAVAPAFGKDTVEKHLGKGRSVPDGYVDVIIYGGPTVTQAKGVGVLAAKKETTSAKVKDAEPSAKTLEEYGLINGVHAYVPADAVDALRAKGYTVEENGEAHLLLNASGPVVFADRARRLGFNGNGTKVCILDTGIDFLHTQLKMPAPNHIADFYQRVDGPSPPDANGTLRSYNVYVNQSFSKLNWSINWGNTGNRFDIYIWYPNGTYAGGTNTSTPFLAYVPITLGTYWWMNVTLNNTPPGLYNITVNTTSVSDPTLEYFSVYWEPYNTQNTQYEMIMSDIMGHGTHVAGTIVGNSSNYPGIAQGADIYIGRVCSPDGASGGCGDAELLSGMQWCANSGVDIMSMSIGAPDVSCTDSLAVGADNAADSLLPVIAAGNNGTYGAFSTASPGCARKVVAVGAVDNSGSVTSWSSRGPTYSGQKKPDVVAPGDDITSTYPVNTFQSDSGTSMATPHVSAVAAIAKQANPTWTQMILKAALMATATKSNGGNHLDNNYGAGMADAMMLVNMSHYDFETSLSVSSIHRGDSFSAYSRWRTPLNGYKFVNATNRTNMTVNLSVPNNTQSLKAVLYWQENSSDNRSQTYLYLIDPTGAIRDNSTLLNSSTQMVYNSTPPNGTWQLNVSGANTEKNNTVVFYSMRLYDNSFAYVEYNSSGAPTNFTASYDTQWANITNTTNASWAVGVYPIRFCSNNTFGNWSCTALVNLTLNGWAEINESASPASATAGTNFDAYCRVRDTNTTLPIQGYNISFWTSDLYLGSATSAADGWAVLTASASAGSYTLKCNITNSTALYYDVSAGSNSTSLTVNAAASVPSGGGGGGGGSSVSSAPIRVESDLTQWFAYGIEHNIPEFPAGSIAYYYFAGENHTIKAAAVTSAAVVLTITSAPYNITLSVGETRNLDLNGDGHKDLAVTLNGIKDGEANVTFSKLAEAALPVVTANSTSNETANVTQPNTPQENGDIGPVTEALLAVFGIVAVGLAAAAIIKPRGKPKRRR